MQLNLQLSLQDVVDFKVISLKESGGVFKILIKKMILFLVLYLLLALSFYSLGYMFLSVLVFTLMIIILFFVALTNEWGIRRYYKKMHSKPDQAFLLEPIKVEVSKSKIEISRGGQKGTYLWSEFTNYVESNRILILNIRGGSGIVFPKRQLKGKIKEFKAILESSIKK